MQHHLAKMFKVSDPEKPGYPKLKHKDVVPHHTDRYTALEDHFDGPESNKPHKELPFLNECSVVKVVTDMKDRGMYPCQVKAKDMPNGVMWNNFPQVC